MEKTKDGYVTMKNESKAIGGRARAASLSNDRRSEIARNAADSRWGVAGSNSSKNNELTTIQPQNPATIGVKHQVEIDGVGMGILSDGTPFLTGRGLARLCGVGHGRIQEISADWGNTERDKRTEAIAKILEDREARPPLPYIPITQRSGTFYAYPDVVCLAVLEYYAFDAVNVQETAKKNYRLLAGKALRDFIYTQVGYDPSTQVPAKWRQFHDRVSLTYNSVPIGFFSVFKEIADMILTLGQAGLHIDSKFVPDISVGLAWSKHWLATDGDAKLGERRKFEHNYPNYFPQAASNPQEPWCYPDSALGEFRRWMRDSYIGEGKLLTYINKKVQEKALPASFAQIAVLAYSGD